MGYYAEFSLHFPFSTDHYPVHIVENSIYLFRYRVCYINIIANNFMIMKVKIVTLSHQEKVYRRCKIPFMKFWYILTIHDLNVQKIPQVPKVNVGTQIKSFKQTLSLD